LRDAQNVCAVTKVGTVLNSITVHVSILLHETIEDLH